MEPKKVNEEVQDKRLEEFKRKLIAEVENDLTASQKKSLQSGIRYLEVSGSGDVCLVKLRMNWKSALTWLVVPVLVLVLTAIGIVLSPFIIGSSIYKACKDVLGYKVIDCVTMPEIEEEEE